MDVLGQDRREGLGRKAESRFVLLLMMLVSVLLLLSSLYSAEASVFRKARENVLDVAAPILSIFAKPIAYVQGVVGDVGDYFNTLEQNQALREENAELRQWMEEALRLRETIAVYERLQNYYAGPEATPIDAFVIGESNDAFSHSMLVNAGSGDGVERGQAVLDDQGLVGRIVDVGVRASRILLLTDVQSRVPVYVEDANLEGILVGRTKANPSISFTASTDPVVFTPGQRVLTSGAGGSLPRGLAIGVIVGAEKGDAVVDLYADYARTRMVRIVNYDFPVFEEAPEQGADEAPADAAAVTAADSVRGALTPAAPAGGDPFADPDARAAAAAPPGEPEGVD